ncbi:hypothetical protein AB1Y20_001724 [Prymnesium parvum]|uniref:EF-hand domain-containing protein n=1 Tax=Prymnesium parvum TaxID=97485 RepID=A0AB34KC51_PRYPA
MREGVVTEGEADLGDSPTTLQACAMTTTSKANAYGDQDREAIRKREVFKAIKEGFSLFDRDNKGVCDVREIGTIVRHLGICPTEIELHDMITEIEDEEPNGFIRYERFERMMARVLIETQYPRDSEDKLLRAFRTLDPDNKGYVEGDKIRTLLTTHGERFTQEEIDDFLSFAVDAESGLLHYEDYVMQVCGQ